MSVRRAASLTVLLLFAASAAFASGTAPSSPTPPPPSEPGIPGMSGSGHGGQLTSRQEAEQSYALAYEDIGKAKQDLEDGKAKNAEKKFKRALERCEKAVLFDERYHEAWNLLGFTARKLGDYDKAFKSYERCLAIKPDFAPAREYLGEAWLEKGDPKQARVQLVWLERLNATVELKTLKTSYDAWMAAHPEAAPASQPAVQPAEKDTATAASAPGH